MAVQIDTGMRCLVACGDCRRQYDATGFAAKSRFHCSCGAVVEVPKFDPHSARVVRCSSCGAPRGKAAEACAHCGADYTVHEQDLHTICPSCMTRISDKAKYCHHCATPIVPQGQVGKETRLPCPVCGRRHRLHSRSLGEVSLTLCECRRCAGIWLKNAGFELLAERARGQAAGDLATVQGAAAVQNDAAVGPSGAKQSLYRRCAECQTLMHRRNFGQGSGVVVDTCREHGIWFDAAELDAVLKWIRAGGEARVAKKAADDRRHTERITRMTVDREERPGGFGGGIGGIGTPSGRSRSGAGGFLGEILDAFLDF
jgi:Zn-finger nucleic acid-binding protein